MPRAVVTIENLGIPPRIPREGQQRVRKGITQTFRHKVENGAITVAPSGKPVGSWMADF